MILRIVLLFFFITSLLFSENFIDKLHQNLSNSIVKVSTNTDDFISQKIGLVSKDSKADLNQKINKNDNFFKSTKYLEETIRSYIRISTYYNYNSLGNNDFNTNIHASVDLRNSSKNLKLFISDLNSENAKDLLDKKSYKNDNAAIGVSLMQNIGRHVDVKYSLGIRSLYPYVKARFSIKKQLGSLEFEPVQNFKYSTKNHFSEDTRLYMDKYIQKDLLFRTELGRGTESRHDGMDYDTTFHLFWTLNSKSGFVLTQAFYGNTKYKYTINQSTGEQKKFNGINNYLSQISYRHDIYKKWIFYEISPGVNFSKSDDYKANYRIYLKFDFFFGNL